MVSFVSGLAYQVENGVIDQGFLLFAGLHAVLGHFDVGEIVRVGILLRLLGQLLGKQEMLQWVFAVIRDFGVKASEQVNDLLVAGVQLAVF